MPVPLENLTYLIIQLNKAIDSRQYDRISIAEMHYQIENGGIIQWLNRRIKHFDASLWLPDHTVLAWYDDSIRRIFDAYGGQERRKWGIENKGLCLLLAWTNELIQLRDGIDFS